MSTLSPVSVPPGFPQLLASAIAPVKAGPRALPPLKSGDVVLQALDIPFISNATKSPFTHCGLVEVVDGKAFVIEALQPVRRTPLEQWKARGDGKIEVRRFPGLSGAATTKALNAARQMIGRDYDSQYLWDDQKIYCSELVTKAFAAAGLRVGRLQELGSLALTEADKARARSEGVPLTSKLVTPASLAEDPRLRTIYTDFPRAKH